MAKDKKNPVAIPATKSPEPAVEKAEKTAEPQKVYVTSTELATQLGTKGTILRRWLRTLPRFQDSGYTRYKWDPSDPSDAQFLKDAAESFSKHQKAAESKRDERAAENAKKKAEKEAAGETPAPKKAKKSKKEPEPAADAPDEDEVFEDEGDEEGEELD